MKDVVQSVETHTEGIENLNSPVAVKEMESNNLPKQEAPGPHWFTSEFYQIPRKKLYQILFNLFQKTEAERMYPNSFYEASIILPPKPDALQEKKTAD